MKPETQPAARSSAHRLVSASEVLACDWPLKLACAPNGSDEGYDGSCPCALIHGENFEVEVHCWRGGCEHGCKYSGIHVSGELDKATKRKIAEHIRDNNGWTNHTDWTLVVLGTNAKVSGVAGRQHEEDKNARK